MERAELDCGRVRHGLLRRRRPRARLDAVRPGAALPARAGAAGGAAFGRRGARHLRVPRRRVEPVGAAVALPGRDRRGARPRRARRSRRSPTATPRASRPTSASACTRRCSRPTSSRTSASAIVRSPGRVGLARLELGGLAAGARGRRARRCCGAEGGAAAGARSGAASLETVRRERVSPACAGLGMLPVNE